MMRACGALPNNSHSALPTRQLMIVLPTQNTTPSGPQNLSSFEDISSNLGARHKQLIIVYEEPGITDDEQNLKDWYSLFSWFLIRAPHLISGVTDHQP